MERTMINAKNKFSRLGLMAFFLPILIMSCGPAGPQGARGGRSTLPEDVIFAVNVIPASEGQIKDYLLVNGEVRTISSVDVFPDTAGKLVSLKVSVGDQVFANQVVAELDPSRPGMNFASSPVKSPISGTVLSIPVSTGSTMAPSTPVMQVGRIDELEILSNISERFVSKVALGQRAIIRFVGYPGETWESRVTELSPVLDAASRTLPVTLKLQTQDARVLPGMFPEIQLITETKAQVVKVPQDAIIERFGENFLYVAIEHFWNEIGEDELLFMKRPVTLPLLRQYVAGAEESLLLFAEVFGPEGAQEILDLARSLVEESAGESGDRDLDLRAFVQNAIELEEAHIAETEDILGRKTFSRAEKRVVVPGIEIDNMVEVTQGLVPDELVVVQGQSLLEDGVQIRIINTLKPLPTQHLEN
jgi:membrane fusion protein (multidrug efflux system)